MPPTVQGTPAIGVGAGNTPVVIDPTADIKMGVNSILLSKTFDNGMICASEQAIIANPPLRTGYGKNLWPAGPGLPMMKKLRLWQM